MSATTSSRLTTTALHAWTRLGSCWTAAQVERQGGYSVERMYQLSEYQRSTSLVRAWLVVVATPLPCLVTITLLDCVPLAPPHLGLAQSHLFWLRALLMVFIINATAMVQMRELVPRLAVRTSHIMFVAVTSSITSVATVFALACWIGFPLPFTIALGAPSASAGFAIAVAAAWGRLFRAHPDVQREVVAFVVLTLKQIALIVIYPTFSYVFGRLGSWQQTAFAATLPALKFVCKHLIHSSVRQQAVDFKPELIVFNIEVFHALYVAYSMQTATSRSTIAVLVALDFVQACLALRRVKRLAGSWVTTAGRQMTAASLGSGVSTAAHPTARHTCRSIIRSVAIAPVDSHVSPAMHDAPQLLRLVAYMIETDPSILASADIRAQTCARARRPRTRQVRMDDCDAACRPADLLSVAPANAPKTTTGSVGSSVVVPSRSVEPSQPIDGINATALTDTKCDHDDQVARPLTVLTDTERVVLRALDRSEWRPKVVTALQLLHVTEFAVLVEYTEVMIPVVYCLYLLVMRELPNRVYYAQLKDLSNDALVNNVTNILLYASLEVVSFLVLSLCLSKMLRVSSLHQLAFVLETQWAMVQSKLILWVVFTVQTSLQHFGVDYSFQFQWLHEGPMPQE